MARSRKLKAKSRPKTPKGSMAKGQQFQSWYQKGSGVKKGVSYKIGTPDHVIESRKRNNERRRLRNKKSK